MSAGPERRTAAGIGYLLQYKRVKNLNLRVDRQGQIHVSVPVRVPREEVDRFVASRAGWIERAQARVGRRAAEHTDCPQDGGTVCYLGQPCAVTVLEGRAGVALVGSSLVITQPDPCDEAGRRALWQAWCRARCAQLFEPIAVRYLPQVLARGGVQPHFAYRDMRSRWGSCTRATGRIALSTRLLEKPLAAGEYVVVHELCHLIVPDHSPRFHALVRELLPDADARRALLR